MPTSRRSLLAGAAASLWALRITAAQDRSQDSANSGRSDRAAQEPNQPYGECLDYGRSFICHTAAFNSVRFWVESRTAIIDERAGTTTEFYQCGACKSENTFGAKDLLYEDNYDFLPIFGDGDVLIFRRAARLNENYRQVSAAADVWGAPVLHLRAGCRQRPLETWQQVRAATASAAPIVSQTEIWAKETALRAVIECPVKTMNISVDRQMFQVDTGPVAFPDLTCRYERLIECLRLGFVVFNAPHFADFVLEQPTPVVEGGVEKCKIYHYSNPFSVAATNRLFALAAAE